jgi:lipopolysaccharide transport system ATP-binding protein
MGTISVSNLGKAYKQYPTRWSRLLEWLDFRKQPKHNLKWVLQDINFNVQPGESVGIMGVNGSGKSTLLKMITGTTQPTSGSVHITGRVAALLELGMGFHPDFTGRQNVIMSAQLMGIGAEEILDLLPEIESFAEIGDYLDQPVRIYSSGMQVRLAFSVATALRPDILIVDEALSVGDAYFQAKCFQKIAQFKEAGTTLLLVSHSAGDVVKHCDRALLIKDGRIAIDSSSRIVSNMYLDLLFGGKKVDSSNLNALSKEEKILADSREDVFHTRVGYRKEEHRWGAGGASIIDFHIRSGGQDYPSKIEDNDTVDFYYKVHFQQDFSSVVPGILVKTLEGIFLYGTNSFIASKSSDLISVKAGDSKIFKFSMPMKLNEGHYLVSFGISSGDSAEDLTPLDRRYDSVIIYIARKLQFWGLMDLGADFHCNDSIQVPEIR